VNFGGEPENPRSELPVVIDGLELRRATGLLIVFIVGHFGIDRPTSGDRTGTQLQ
jgi:hypothetical protein